MLDVRTYGWIKIIYTVLTDEFISIKQALIDQYPTNLANADVTV